MCTLQSSPCSAAVCTPAPSLNPCAYPSTLNPYVCPAVVPLLSLEYVAVGGMDLAIAFNSKSTVWGGMIGATAENINVSLATQDDSLLYNASQHPGFSVQPLFYCSNLHNLTALAGVFLFVATSAELADALLQVSMINMTSNPAATAFAFQFFPSVVILEQV